MIEASPRNRSVLFEYLGGEDLNQEPSHKASRWVVNFGLMGEAAASTYQEPWGWVRSNVKPDREKLPPKTYGRIVKNWWQYWAPRQELYDKLSDLDSVIVIARTGKAAIPVMVPTGPVFSEAIVVFATDDLAMLALLSSCVHYCWIVARASTLETRIRYTSSGVFETFALPELTQDLRDLGEKLHCERQGIMLKRNVGLTKLYNEVFDPAVYRGDIQGLREIHRLVDEAAVRAYGWHDLLLDGLEHGFQQAGEETRYTVGPSVQTEILNRLLKSNHDRYTSEVAKGLHDKGVNRGKRKRGSVPVAGETMATLNETKTEGQLI